MRMVLAATIHYATTHDKLTTPSTEHRDSLDRCRGIHFDVSTESKSTEPVRCNGMQHSCVGDG
eukprot:m.450723 g.450723  ORF g.450723 m.450723 type:complete len:63 (-) comp21515_c0_seq20:128-316(-)